jgi:uracil-DNA glycosylase
MTDRDDALRQYLQQRIELGEHTIRLETLTRDEAVRLASSRGKSDWRDSLRAIGAGPEPAAPGPAPMRPAAGLSVGSSARQLFGGSDGGGGAVGALDSLGAIATAVASCSKCALHATAKNPVPGEGNPEAQLMLVGEAPGATEDETGRPFVGAAGQLLTKILQAIDLERDQVFICNVLKHRPPGNRNPLPEEVSACSPYLIRQIELVRPKVIIALGTFAAQTLLNTKLTIGKLRGQVHRYHGVPLVVTYHPAALLRNPAWKRPTWEDVQLARRILDGGDLSPSVDA